MPSSGGSMFRRPDPPSRLASPGAETCVAGVAEAASAASRQAVSPGLHVATGPVLQLPSARIAETSAIDFFISQSFPQHVLRIDTIIASHVRFIRIDRSTVSQILAINALKRNSCPNFWRSQPNSSINTYLVEFVFDLGQIPSGYLRAESRRAAYPMSQSLAQLPVLAVAGNEVQQPRRLARGSSCAAA